MRRLLTFLIAIYSIESFSVVHRFRPEFQAVYDAATKPEVQRAQRKGAEAKIVYKVVDDEGRVVSNVTVNVKWENDYPRKTWYDSFCTDDNGSVEISEKIGGRMSCGFHKDGYYPSFDSIDFHWRKGVSPLIKDGRWQPYGENRTLVVKRIKNPVEMKFHNWGIYGYKAPETNVWIGLDLECGQWCKPYGNGRYEDVMVRFRGKIVDDFTWDTETEISFTNVPYAGFYLMEKEMLSSMKTCYNALTNDSMYVEQIIKFTSMGRKNISPNKQTADKIPSDKYLVFRTRCIVDEKSRLISAHYGKISGQFGGLLRLLFFSSNFSGDEAGIYFNPNPNDTNLEAKQ